MYEDPRHSPEFEDEYNEYIDDQREHYEEEQRLLQAMEEYNERIRSYC